MEQAQNQITQWREQAGRIQAPDQKDLAELERLCSRRLQLQTQFDSALLHVELRPKDGRRVEVILGESPGIRQLGAGESLRVSGSPAIGLDLEGFGRLTVTGPAQSATELKEQLGTTIGLIDGFAARFGTSDVAELRQRHLESIGLELQSANEEKAVRGLLNGRTVKSLRADARRLDEEVEAAEVLHPDWRNAPPDPGNLKRQLAEARKAFEERRSTVTASWKQRQTDLAGAQKGRIGFETEREHLRRQSVDDQGQLSKLRADGLSDLDRSERLARLSVEVVGLDAKYKQELGCLQKVGDDPRPALGRAQGNLEAADEAYHKSDRALHEHRGTLKGMLDRAPYEQCAKIEEEIKQLREEIDRDQLRADALKLLRETITECEEEATAGVAGPVAERASKLLHRIAGKRMGAISLNDELALWGVGPAETDETIDLEILSGGEREQVHLAMKPACGATTTRARRGA